MNPKICCNCTNWKRVDDIAGKCGKIEEKIGVHLVTGWDGGYVKSIETDGDFGCNLFEKLR